MNRPKTPLFFHFARGNHHEPPVQNEEFLRSYIEFGAGLRAVTAYQQHSILENAKSTPLERTAAVCALYQSLGMLYEDLAATVVSWTAWAGDSSLSLADIVERIALTSTVDAYSGSTPYHEERALQFSNTAKRVRVCSQQFFESLATLNGEKLLQTLGVPWKEFPSVKLVPRELNHEWATLPTHCKSLLQPLSDKKSILLTASYNKIKHGPQMVMMNPYERATKNRGITDAPESFRTLSDRFHVRLLFDGARTQESQDDLGAGRRVAPFLLDDPRALDGLLMTLVSAANVMRILAWWRYRVAFGEFLPYDVDPIISTIAAKFKTRLQDPLYMD